MKRFSTLALTTALALSACSGGGDTDDSATPAEASRSVTSTEETTASTTTTTAAPTAATTAPTTAPLAPSNLAFASSDDVGRLFTLASTTTATTSAGGETAASEVPAGTVVQTSSLRTRDDVQWVRIESTEIDGGTLGWVRASALSPTTEPVLFTNPDEARQFRQVSRSVPGDFLGILAEPGVGSPIVSLAEGSVALHGGVTALATSGDEWLDVLDPSTGEQLGWVESRFFRPVTSGVLQDETGNTLERDAIDGLDYGQDLVGGISTTGCNAIQVRFNNASASAGLGVVFGTDSPIGRELGSGDFQWLGTSAFSEAGADLVITIPTSSAQPWFFAPLDEDGQASWTTRDENDRAVADDVVTIDAPASSCEFVPPAAAAAEDLDGPIDETGTLTEAEIERLAIINGEVSIETEEGAEGEDGTEPVEGADGEATNGEADADTDEATPAADAPATPADAIDPAAEADPNAATDPAAAQ